MSLAILPAPGCPRETPLAPELPAIPRLHQWRAAGTPIVPPEGSPIKSKIRGSASPSSAQRHRRTPPHPQGVPWGMLRGGREPGLDQGGRPAVRRERLGLVGRAGGIPEERKGWRGDASSPPLQPSSPPARLRASASLGPRMGRSRRLIYPWNSLLRIRERQSSRNPFTDHNRPDRHHRRPRDGLDSGGPGSGRLARSRFPALRHHRSLLGRLLRHLRLSPRPLSPSCLRLSHPLPLLCVVDAPDTLPAPPIGSASYAKDGGRVNRKSPRDRCGWEGARRRGPAE